MTIAEQQVRPHVVMRVGVSWPQCRYCKQKMTLKQQVLTDPVFDDLYCNQECFELQKETDNNGNKITDENI
jgi:hypothetical protein